MPKKHERLTPDVALALTDGRVQLYSKRGRQLLPLNQDAQLMHRQLLQKIHKGAIGPEDISVITLDLSPSNSTRNLAKVFQKASKEELGDVFKRLVSTQVLENHRAWLTTLGVALLSAVPSFTQDVLPFLPIIQISGAAKVPGTLSLLLAMVNESPCWKSKGWMLSLPWVQTAKYAPFDSRPSLDLADYAGGTIKINGKKRTFSIPYASGCVAFEANIPAAVRQQIIAESPRMIPLFCGFTCKIENREIMRLDGKDFLNYDPAALSGLQQKNNLIAVIVRLFLNWFGGKKKRQEAYKREIATFLPVVRNGRFQQVAKNTQSETMAAALTVWKAFLCFAIKKQWIVEEKARDILAEFWSVLLPESAPQVKSSDTNNIWGGSAEPSTFYHYLHDFIHTYQAQIAKAVFWRLRTLHLPGTSFSSSSEVHCAGTEKFCRWSCGCYSLPVASSLIFNSTSGTARLRRSRTFRKAASMPPSLSKNTRGNLLMRQSSWRGYKIGTEKKPLLRLTSGVPLA